MAAWALGLLGVLVLLVLASQNVAAVGSGKTVNTDPTGSDNGGPSQYDALRIGMGSDGTNLYIWHLMNIPYQTTQTPPSSNERDQISFYFATTPPTCYYIKGPNWNTDDTTPAGTVYNAAGCGAAGSLMGSASASRVCNELFMSVPLGLIGNPASGVSITTGHPTGLGNSDDLFIPLITGDSATPTVNQFDYIFPKGSYTLGSAYNVYQDAPTLSVPVAVGDNTVRLTWSLTDNGSQPVTTYRIYRSTTGTAGPYTLLTTVTGTTTYDDPNLSSGTNYAYKVSAVNCPQHPAKTPNPSGEPAWVGGEGVRSAAQAITPDFKPALPTGLAVTGETSTSLKLAWTAPTVDCPTFGPSCPSAGSAASPSGVKGYAVYRAVDPDVPVWVKNIPSDSTICTGTSCQWIDTALTTGTKYCYVIRAYDGYQMSPPYTPPAVEPTLPNMSAKTSPAQCATPAGAAPSPTCSASPSSVNTGQSTTFTGASGSGSYTWSGGETPSATGSGPTFTTAYSTTGTKTVTVTSGTQTGTCSVTVTAPLVPTCSASPATVVTSQSTTITGFGGDGTYTWSGGGSPATGSGATFMTSYTTTGTKTVTVTSNGQNSTCSVTVNLPGPPSCSGSPALATIGQTVVFTGASGNGVFVWSGGGSPATGGGVTFSTSFSSTGTKSISVTSASQTATCNVTIQPNQPPVASFSAQPMSVQIGQPVSFVDASTDPDYNDYVAGWQWSFGDGYVATASGPTHSYATIGSYQACLVALDTHGVASASACRTISVQGAAGASQTPPPPAPEPQPVAPTDSDDGDDSDELAVTAPSSLLVRPGDEVALTAAAPDAKNPTWSWVQTYGSRVVLSEAQTANATFSAPHAETMLYFEAQARDGSRVGITGTRVVVRIDNTAPVAGANGPAAGEVGKVVAFDALTSMDADGDMLQFRWIQVAGPTAVVADAERIAARFTPTEAGTYRFAVEVSDGRASGVAFHTVQVADAPEISQEVVKESGGDQVGSGVSNGDADSESATQASREAAAQAGNAGLLWVAGGLVIVGIVVAVSVALLKRRKITAPPA